MKAVFHHRAGGQIEFQRIGGVAAGNAQRQQHFFRLLDIVRHAVEINIVAQDFVEGRHVKQHPPLRQPAAVRRGAAHAVHAFRMLGTLVEMVHLRAVFLTKRNLVFVLQHGGDGGFQRFVVRPPREMRQGFGMGLGGERLDGRVVQPFQIGKGIVWRHGGRQPEKSLKGRIIAKSALPFAPPFAPPLGRQRHGATVSQTPHPPPERPFPAPARLSGCFAATTQPVSPPPNPTQTCPPPPLPLRCRPFPTPCKERTGHETRKPSPNHSLQPGRLGSIFLPASGCFPQFFHTRLVKTRRNRRVFAA